MNKKGESKLTIVITVFAILIILVLSFLFYYYAVKSMSFSRSETASLSGYADNAGRKESAGLRTNVIIFKPSEVLPQQQKEGYCFSYLNFIFSKTDLCIKIQPTPEMAIFISPLFNCDGCRKYLSSFFIFTFVHITGASLVPSFAFI